VQDNHVPDDAALAERVEVLASRLKELGWTLSTAESCTGGWIAKCCTDRAGSSAWFERGFVTYSNGAKRDMLGVEEIVLEQAGAVSSEAAMQMVSGAIARAGTETAVAVTGIAGPDGGSHDKPVGSVWLAWSIRGSVEAELKQFPGDREAVRRYTVSHALQGLIDRLPE
jgi:nicotinamide-nucleotide amidase